MKRIVLLLSLGFAAGATAFAKQVDEQTAISVARNFVATRMSNAQPAIKLLTTSSVSQSGGTAINTYYVFDVNNQQGFVVVAADDIVKPVLAYSFSNAFQAGDDASPETRYWMGLYRDQIQFAVQHQLEASKAVIADWDYYTGAVTGGMANKPTNEVTPMLTTTWNQGTYYNIYTPGTGSGKTPVGCVATAMAQIMKYWNYPTTGTSSYSYTQNPYGQLSADFGSTMYQWGVMSDNLTGASSAAAKDAVSTLGYHCAVSVRMNFAPNGSGSQVLAWSANSKCAENAFKNYFGYKSTIEGYYREDYSDADWDALLKQEIDNGRPLLYAGFGDLGGHAFVFDGYDAAGLYHINWGWGGMSNGYFTVNNLAPSALGIGGGGGNFNEGQQILTKIEPNGTPDVLDLVLKNALTVSVPEITQGESFSVNGKVGNRGILDFSGQLTAGLFRTSDNSMTASVQILGYLQIATVTDTGVVFQMTSTNALPAGDYTIRLLYRQEGKTIWNVLPDDLGFTNSVPFTVRAKDNPTGIAETALDRSLSVYPVPASTQLILDRKGFAGKISGIELYTLQGQRIGSAVPGNTVTTIPVSQLANGVYFLRVTTDQGTSNKQIVVKH
ncbi:thiol protease/hemagglutinin PrtT [Taibaiella koreensis]|uniref:thiol protease/hemagglutinin PrtT n=1 Tax=Taibaiella koreensis TaxID=1268548 RepID=UPI000E59E98E|nr:thiol protease/hemagglutinin PrtT [Taibaiella koreensis]